MAIDATITGNVFIVTANGSGEGMSIRENDSGFDLQLTVKKDATPVDISGIDLNGSLLCIHGRNGGQAKPRTPTFVTDGADGAIQYTVQPGDFDKIGPWYLHLCLREGGLKINTSKFTLEVERL